MAAEYSAWRVLAIDDEADNLKLITALLELKGATVAAAGDGYRGLELVDEFEPTLILLDLAMPHIDGFEVQRQLRARSELDRVPIVALTALALTEDARKVWAAGFDGYISKPFRVQALLDELMACMKAFSNPTLAGDLDEEMGRQVEDA